MSYEIVDMKLGGWLDVRIGVAIAPAEPDVGIMTSYVDEYHILKINGKPTKEADGKLSTKWVHDLIERHGKKWVDDIVMAAFKQHDAERYDDDRE